MTYGGSVSVHLFFLLTLVFWILFPSAEFKGEVAAAIWLSTIFVLSVLTILSGDRKYSRTMIASVMVMTTWGGVCLLVSVVYGGRLELTAVYADLKVLGAIWLMALLPAFCRARHEQVKKVGEKYIPFSIFLLVGILLFSQYNSEGRYLVSNLYSSFSGNAEMSGAQYYEYRPSSLMGNPNLLGMTLIFLLVSYGALNRQSGAVYWICISLVFYGVVASKSRTSFFVLVFYLGLVHIFLRQDRKKHFLLFFLFVAAVLIFPYLFDVELYKKRYVTGIDLAGRTELWEEVVQTILSFPEILTGMLYKWNGDIYIDNDFIFFAAVIGVPGLLFYLVHIYILWTEGGAKRDVMVLLLCYFLFATTSSPVTSIKTYYIFLCSLAVVLSASKSDAVIYAKDVRFFNEKH
ncbi:O-antigen ligase family protein [Alloalcanivorax xenomutans]|uniref:O-antigen ligase family protein n=1 Tax=Alloalcanivorax xenomutans TaxID=1094342 RepID=A0A9Q3W2Z5_9GAMM|nr:O-antigen ligase family protein [Alloalcanivorax xenomutans]MCE7507670.1 O-antigen ligase family protein [Alloalcanivorax xenomutans]